MSVFAVRRLDSPAPGPGHSELITLEVPQVGESMTLYRTESGRRLCTTDVVRVLALAEGAMFVQTKNTVYRLDTLTHMPFTLPRTGNDW